MNIIEIINKKKTNQELSKEEIYYFVSEYVKDNIQDYQASALLMAILINGMNAKESAYLTKAMMHSGDVMDLSLIPGIKVDKHSTGGVGDKVSLILGPLVASAGAKVAKMSGRGLGHTGGTLDKLEAIPGYNVNLNYHEFINQVKKINIAIIGQTANLVPADKKLYALRDVSGTVDSIPLIASSIMSKKLACGADAILLDIKVGKGAFMKNKEQGIELATLMCNIAKELDKNIVAIITGMNQPLGHAIGNSLEIKEAVATLKGKGPKDLTEICLKLGSIMLLQAELFDNAEQAYEVLKTNLHNGLAFNKFVELVNAQGGDSSYLTDPDKFADTDYVYQVRAKKAGYVIDLDALKIGELALELGAGRKTKEDPIDYDAGIYLHKKINDKVAVNEIIATLYTNKVNIEFVNMCLAAYQIDTMPTKDDILIKEIVSL